MKNKSVKLSITGKIETSKKGDIEIPYLQAELNNTGLQPTNNGLHATWPALAGPLGIQIDHALIKNINAYHFKTGGFMGSDHRALFLTITAL